ncbi:hypothetical protein GOP47_0019347 [Adiantum capillus-veneris]|uniref:Pentatricopeptide repeat-containing protein n=1 Tax=Adiantum capillus-veneris TaxID=13818 RepID=A0A9D4UFW1_ADICA|nr:hypothetical protein GOP47_0019347 [Adiantum capillus-veneris]
MRSIARAFYIRSLSSSHGRMPACTIGPFLISHYSRLCCGSDSERDATETGFNTDEYKKGFKSNFLFLERLQGVPRNQPLVPMLQSWIKAGHHLGPVEMRLIFGKLEWKQKYSQALEVMEWLLKERPFEPEEHNYARWLIYLGKVGDYGKVERAFKDIPFEYLKEVVYCRLFDVALEHKKLSKAIGVMKSMRKQDIPVPVYMFNNLIKYYVSNSMPDKVHVLLRLMEEQNIEYDLQTYNTLLSLSSRKADMEGMEKIWGHLQADISVRPDFVSYATMASAYFFAGQHEKASAAARKAERLLTGKAATVVRLKKLIVMHGLLKQEEGVSRIYRRLKTVPGKTSIFSYTCVVEAYGEAGLVDKAEEVMKEMELQKRMDHLAQFNTIIGVYCKNGMLKKAEEFLEKLEKNHKPDVITHSHLLLGYLKSEQLEKALEKLKKVIVLVKDGTADRSVFELRAWLLIIQSVIGLLGERGDKKIVDILLTALQEANFVNFPSSYKFITRAYEQSFGCAWLGQAEK